MDLSSELSSSSSDLQWKKKPPGRNGKYIHTNIYKNFFGNKSKVSMNY